MKTIIGFLLALSLLLNATFAYLHFKQLAAPAPAGTASAGIAIRPRLERPIIDSQTWASLHRAELSEQVERLRASGFPPATVRAIVAAQLRESFALRRKALMDAAGEIPYWKTPQPDPTTQAALRQLSREESKTLRDLVGEDADDPLMRLSQNPQLGFLAPEKAAEVRQIIREYEERRMDLYSSGFNYAVDREKITALEKEQRTAIAGVLTRQEFLEYELRNSNTANRLRDELAAFEPTEEEYRAIFPLRVAFDEQYGEITGIMSMEESRRRGEAQKLMTQQIKAVLSPARASEYDRKTDYNYRRTSQLVARLELPPDTTDQLYAIQKEYETRRNELYRGVTSSGDRERVTEQLKTMQQEATARVTPLLGGDRGLEAYKQYGGYWIPGLVPRPRPAPPGR